MNIAVAGTGYVGMSIATLLAQNNHVTAVDVIPEKVEKINNKISPIQDDYIEKYLAEKECELGKDSVMYLDCGIGAFMFSNKSYLKYFYPLPLERIKATDEFAQTTTYKETKKKAMEYSGEYIVLQEAWFCVHGNNMDILEKIKKEYYLEKRSRFPAIHGRCSY